MNKCDFLYIDVRRRRVYRALIFSWLLGFVSGALGRWVCHFQISTTFDFLSGFRFSSFLPILDVLLSLAISWGFSSRGLICLAFIRSATFSWAAVGLRCSFGSAGWLLWPMLLYSELLFFPFLFLFWLRLLSEQWGRLDLFLCLTVAAIVSLTDFWLVMPFVAFLIDSK